MCDGCSEWIIAPHCVECSADFAPNLPESARPFVDDSGAVLICPHCLAKEVANHRATKTGKRQYTLTADQWYRVNSPTVFSR